MFSLPLLFSTLAVANAYVWPSPTLDALESARWDQNGHNAVGFAGFVVPCDLALQGFHSGRANVADWVRTSYHDMATHNVEDGTGGLDASIRFSEETSRAEVRFQWLVSILCAEATHLRRTRATVSGTLL